MRVKRTINRALGLAGVQLVRTATLAAHKDARRQLTRRTRDLDREVAELRRRLEVQGGQLTALGEQAEDERSRAELERERAERAMKEHAKLRALNRKRWWDIPPDYHPDMVEIWAAVKERTMVGHEKLNFFCDAARYVSEIGLEGDVVECGVWRGGAMLGCAMVLDALGDHTRDLYLYDTYDGMSEPTDRDVHLWNGRTAEQELAAKSRTARIWEAGQLADVQAGFDAVGYPRDRLHFVVGKVEDTIPQTAPDRISILRLDTDWYESTKHELEHLYDRLVPGGVLIIDDYGSWQGSRDATDEFFATLDDPPLLTRVGRGRNAIKPGHPVRRPADQPTG